MRTFIAVPCPQDIKNRLFELGKEFVPFGEMKFVEEENMHFTLKFLGEIDENKAQKVSKALAGITSKGFEISVKGLGVFPNRNYPRVLWAGVEIGGTEMDNLHNEVEKLMEALGFEKDLQYTSHLTIARVKNLRNKEAFYKTLEKYLGTEFGTCPVERIDFMESRLSRSGPAYFTVSSANLKLFKAV
jgi:2'-5' RNA ligase